MSGNRKVEHVAEALYKASDNYAGPWEDGRAPEWDELTGELECFREKYLGLAAVSGRAWKDISYSMLVAADAKICEVQEAMSAICPDGISGAAFNAAMDAALTEN